jgi:nitrile hydratase accessory protein
VKTACSWTFGRAILRACDPKGSLKRRDDEPIFGEPWHAQAMGMADLLVRSGDISDTSWAAALSMEIETASLAGKPDNSDTYYEAVVSALERLLRDSKSVLSAELAQRRDEWRRAYLHTPHGKPVDLATGQNPDD